jgi:uncharacterized membrane protein YhaH (DUF805 family)
MMEWYNNRFANFSDRATRKEYGYYILFNIVLALVLYLMSRITDNKLALFFNFEIYLLVLFVPMQAVTIRRLHDLGMKWYFVILNWVPFVNLLFTLYLLIAKGEKGVNRFGEDPNNSDDYVIE